MRARMNFDECRPPLRERSIIMNENALFSSARINSLFWNCRGNWWNMHSVRFLFPNKQRRRACNYVSEHAPCRYVCCGYGSMIINNKKRRTCPQGASMSAQKNEVLGKISYTTPEIDGRQLNITGQLPALIGSTCKWNLTPADIL